MAPALEGQPPEIIETIAKSLLPDHDEPAGCCSHASVDKGSILNLRLTCKTLEHGSHLLFVRHFFYTRKVKFTFEHLAELAAMTSIPDIAESVVELEIVCPDEGTTPLELRQMPQAPEQGYGPKWTQHAIVCAPLLARIFLKLDNLETVVFVEDDPLPNVRSQSGLAGRKQINVTSSMAAVMSALFSCDAGLIQISICAKSALSTHVGLADAAPFYYLGPGVCWLKRLNLDFLNVSGSLAWENWL